jgi:lysophospholipase L1-like esterase
VKRAAAVVVGAWVAALVALVPLVAPPAAHAAPLRVSVFGDSVLLGASEEISATLAGNDVSVDAHENLSLLGALSTLGGARPNIGDVVVLDYGYNDGTDLGAWRSRVDQAMTILQGVPRVVWLDQREFAPGRAEMNAELRAAAARYPNLDVVDWNAAVAAHPDYVYSDGIHLTPSGQQGMADLVHARVAAFVTDRVAALTTTTTSTTSTTTTTAPPATTKPVTGGREGSAAGTTAHGASGGADGWWIAALVAAVLVVAGVVVVFVRRRAASRAP